jgi:hypothetical protein
MQRFDNAGYPFTGTDNHYFDKFFSKNSIPSNLNRCFYRGQFTDASTEGNSLLLGRKYSMRVHLINDDSVVGINNTILTDVVDSINIYSLIIL